MTLRATLSEDVEDTSFWLGFTPSGDNIPLLTLHSSGGSSDIHKVYIFNDGKRDSDGDISYEYQYKNVRFKPRGKRTKVLNPQGTISSTATQIPVEDASLYNAGTKLKNDPINKMIEEIWVRSLSGNNLICDRGKNGTTPIDLPSGTWLEAKPDHVYLSLTGKDGTWINGTELVLPNILNKFQPISFYVKISTGALKTQIKLDTYFEILADEYPKYL